MLEVAERNVREEDDPLILNLGGPLLDIPTVHGFETDLHFHRDSRLILMLYALAASLPFHIHMATVLAMTK